MTVFRTFKENASWSEKSGSSRKSGDGKISVGVEEKNEPFSPSYGNVQNIEGSIVLTKNNFYLQRSPGVIKATCYFAEVVCIGQKLLEQYFKK